MTPFLIILLSFSVQVAATVVVFMHCRQKRSVGFPLLYFLNLAVIHGGVLVYLTPDYNPSKDLYLLSYAMTSYTVPLGCLATALGTTAMVMGIKFQKHLFVGTRIRAKDDRSDERFTNLTSNILLAVGIPSFLISHLLPGLGLDAVFQAGQNCAVLGFILKVHLNLRRNRLFFAFLAMLGYSMLPAYYFFLRGFLSYGFQYFLLLGCVIGCNAKYTRPRALWTLALAPLFAYLLLSLAVVYLENRKDLRSVLWSDANLGRRISISMAVLSRFHFFDPTDNGQLALIDARFNQNIFIGKSVEYLQRNPTLYGNGSTIRDAALGFVPRMFWRNKPIFGGTQIISQFTGMRFSKTVTMQIGLIFESFANFGWFGILVLMFLYGCAIEFVDTRATIFLHHRQLADFVPYFLVGMTLSWPGTSLMAQVASITAILLLAIPLRLVLDFESQRHRSSIKRFEPQRRLG